MTLHPAANIWDCSLAVLLAQARMPSAAFWDWPRGRLTFLFQEFLLSCLCGGRALWQSTALLSAAAPGAAPGLAGAQHLPGAALVPLFPLQLLGGRFWGTPGASLGFLCIPGSPSSPVGLVLWVYLVARGWPGHNQTLVPRSTLEQLPGALAACVCNPTITDTWQQACESWLMSRKISQELQGELSPVWWQGQEGTLGLGVTPVGTGEGVRQHRLHVVPGGASCSTGARAPWRHRHPRGCPVALSPLSPVCVLAEKEEVDHPNNSFSPCSIHDRKCLQKQQAKRVNNGNKMRNSGSPYHREETRPIVSTAVGGRHQGGAGMGGGQDGC